MENTTRALLMAAGVLIAILILALIVFAYNQITNYYSTKQEGMTETQIVEFNNQYEAYNRDDVTGFELVSLINKIIDYNANNTIDSDLGFANSSKGYTKMYIKFTINNTGQLFTDKSYDSEYSNTNDKLESIIKEMQSLENKYNATSLSKLISNYDYLNVKDYGGDGSKTIKEVLGKDVSDSDLPSLTDLKKYEEYVEFKRANFKCTETEYDNSTGRITKIIFTQTS